MHKLIIFDEKSAFSFCLYKIVKQIPTVIKDTTD